MNAKDDRPKKLGRGLSALLGDEPAAQKAAPAGNAEGGPQTIPVEYLVPGEFQPRRHFDQEELKALASSIRERGILQPILVRESGPDRYEIIAGERRWRAAQMAQLHEVPVLVRDIPDEAVLEAALVENVQRADLNPLEEAAGYVRLMEEFGYTQKKLSQVIGKSRSHIANTVRLDGLPPGVKLLLEAGKLTAGHVRPLIGLNNADVLAHKIVAEGMTARQAESLARGDKGSTKGSAKSRPPAPAKDPDTIALEKSLTDLLGLRVTIDFQGEAGRIAIDYKTLEQLDDIIQRLSEV